LFKIVISFFLVKILVYFNTNYSFYDFSVNANIIAWQKITVL